MIISKKYYLLKKIIKYKILGYLVKLGGKDIVRFLRKDIGRF